MTLRASRTEIILGPTPQLIGDPLSPGEIQETNVWCWAACVEAILRHYGISQDRQCRIAERGLELISRKATCCDGKNDFNDNENCLCSLPDEAITALWQEYPPLSVQSMARRLTASDLQSKLDQNRHVEIGYGGYPVGHVMIAHSYAVLPPANDINFVVLDPENGQQMLIPLDSLDDVNGGQWVASWIISKA